MGSETEIAAVDPWSRRILDLRARVGIPASLPGRVLRIKLGYNPNSSSVGSVVSILIWTATFGTIAANVVAALLLDQAKSARSDDGSAG